MERTTEIRKVLIITLILNLLVATGKIAYGYYSGSVAILSDGFHSIFDGVSNVFGLIGVYLSSHPPDEKHPYGHRKYETVFTIFVGVLMFGTCLEIFKKVYASITTQLSASIEAESFIVMILTMLVNIFVTLYENKKGRELQSEFLIADSQHTRSDIYVTTGVIVSLVFVRFGFPLADPLAGMAVGGIIAYTGMNIIREAMETLVDRHQESVTEIKKIVCAVVGVVECHEIRTRGTKNSVFVDIHVLVAPQMTVAEAHMISDRVEYELKMKMPNIVDVVVHIEPHAQ